MKLLPLCEYLWFSNSKHYSQNGDSEGKQRYPSWQAQSKSCLSFNCRSTSWKEKEAEDQAEARCVKERRVEELAEIENHIKESHSVRRKEATTGLLPRFHHQQVTPLRVTMWLLKMIIIWLEKYLHPAKSLTINLTCFLARMTLTTSLPTTSEPAIQEQLLVKQSIECQRSIVRWTAVMTSRWSLKASHVLWQI